MPSASGITHNTCFDLSVIIYAPSQAYMIIERLGVAASTIGMKGRDGRFRPVYEKDPEPKIREFSLGAFHPSRLR
jgi:hypothetical protein